MWIPILKYVVCNGKHSAYKPNNQQQYEKYLRQINNTLSAM